MEMYLKRREKEGPETYKRISELLADAKKIHKRDWEKNPTPGGDHEQSWRAFKGKNMQKLIMHIIRREVKEIGLKTIDGAKLERKNPGFEIARVTRNLLINYGIHGHFLPDVDIVIYDPKSLNVICVISSKVTLRERIAQTGYWKYKLLENQLTEHIKVYFVTPDEDGTLTRRSPALKGRAIVETDLDGSYVLTEEELEESEKVKLFEHFIDDLKNLLKKDEKIKQLLKERPAGRMEKYLDE
jgi:type II restriction enzyme